METLAFAAPVPHKLWFYSVIQIILHGFHKTFYTIYSISWGLLMENVVGINIGYFSLDYMGRTFGEWPTNKICKLRGENFDD